jgi:hypothetical protein
MFRLLVAPGRPKLKEHIEGAAALKEGSPLRMDADPTAVIDAPTLRPQFNH